MAVGILRCAEERHAAGEEPVQHRLGDGVRQRQAGQRCGEGVFQVHAYCTAIQEDDLAHLEEEQRQRRDGEDHQRRVHAVRDDDHRRRPQQRADGEEDVHAIGDPWQPAGQEVITLAAGQLAVLAAQQGAGVVLDDLDGAIGPAEALLLEVDEGVRHQALAVAVVGVGRRQAFFEHTQAQFGVFADAPFGPAQFFQHRAPGHGHGAVLDDRVTVVAGDHANVEKALVLAVAQLLERAFVLVAVVLRRLHHGNFRVGEVRHHVLEPVAVDAVVRVDHRDHFGVLGGVRDQVVQRATLETGQGRDVEELETLAEFLAVGLQRLPHGRVLGVVVDHQHFVVGVVQCGQGIEGLLHHLGRLVVARHMHRHLGPVGAVGLHRQELAAALVYPYRLGQFVGFGQQHDEHAQRAKGQQHAHGQAEPGAVLLAVVVGDPHQHRPAQEGDEGEEGTAALTQGRAIDE